MTNIIVVSDVHLDDFNSSIPGQRLKNYLRLAEIIRDKVKELNAPWVFMAGDILNKPISPPHVVATLQQFFSIILESGCQIAFICGQHDQNVKELEDLRDSYLGVFVDSKKVFYAHEKTLTIEKTRIYFENFTRSMEVDPLKESDIYISHVTLGKQKVNNSKFKLGLFGDIHDKVQIDNMMSINPPLQVHAFEPPNNTIGILTIDGDRFNFKRWEYDPEHKIFPVLERVVRQIKTDNELTDEERQVVDILSNQHNFYEDIEKIIEQLNLTEIHRQINMAGAPEPVSIDFKILKIYARDFQSIQDVCINFNDAGKIIFISGSNGCGKTSIMESIFVALLGDRRMVDRYQSKRDGVDIMVGVVLEYKGITYEICRGNGYTKFFIDGNEVTKASKTRLEDYIYETLPFLNIIWFFYIKTYEHFFDKNRVDLIKKCFNLEVFDYLYTQGKTLLSQTRSDLSVALDKTNQLKGKYDQEKEHLEQYKLDLRQYNDVDVHEEEDVQSQLNTLRNTLIERASRKSKSEILKKQIRELEGKIKDLAIYDQETVMEQLKSAKEQSTLSLEMRSTRRSIEQIDSLLNSLEDVTCPNCGTTFQYGGKSKQSLNQQKETLEELLKSQSNRFAELSQIVGAGSESTIERTLKQLNELEIYRSQLEKYKLDLEQIYSEMRDLDFDLSLMPMESDLQAKILQIGKKKVLLQGEQRSKESIQLITSQAFDLKEERKKLQYKIELCEKYVNLFDIKNLDSLPYKILERISQYLSTEEVQFKTYSEMANGNLKLDISCTLKVGDTYIDYDRCSHGQKTMLDLYILSKLLEILNGTGVVAIDEGLSVLNSDKYDEACEMIRDLKAHNVILTSHQLSFNYYDSLISCSLDSHGVTQWEVMK